MLCITHDHLVHDLLRPLAEGSAYVVFIAAGLFLLVVGFKEIRAAYYGRK